MTTATDNGYANTTYRNPLCVEDELEALEYARMYGAHIIARWNDQDFVVYPGGRVELIRDN